MALHGDDKILFYTVFAIYSETIAFIFLIPFIGILISGIVISVSIPATLFAVKYYRLVLRDKLRDEIGSIPFWTGWIIDKNGVWRYIDFGVTEKQEIMISDKDMAVYESETQFQDALEKISDENPDFAELIDSGEFQDQYTDRELAKEYRDVGLATSRQIYAFEMILAFFEINDKLYKETFIKIDDGIKKKAIDPTKITEFEQIIYELIGFRINKAINIQITDYLEERLGHYGITDGMAYNSQIYKKAIVSLEKVEHIGKSKEEVKKLTIKNAIPFIFAILTCLLSVILIVYIKLTVIPMLVMNKSIGIDEEIGMGVLSSITFIPIVLAFFFALKTFKTSHDDANMPYKIVFKNTITKRFAFESYCEIRKRLRQYGSDARIYKVYPLQKYRKLFPNEYVIVILPASYEDSLEFDGGTVMHRGHSVDVSTTPIVMAEIGSLIGDIPIYSVIACTYHFKRFTKIFYTTNLNQIWKNKIYLHIIASIQAQLQTSKADRQVLKIRVDEWQNWAIEQAQQIALDREKRIQELMKTRNIQHRENETLGEPDEENEEPPQKPQQKKKAGFIGPLIFIMAAVIIFFVFKSLI